MTTKICPFCSTEGAALTKYHSDGEDVFECFTCKSTFTSLGDTVVWYWDGGDDLPDGWEYDALTGEPFEVASARNLRRP